MGDGLPELCKMMIIQDPTDPDYSEILALLYDLSSRIKLPICIPFVIFVCFLNKKIKYIYIVILSKWLNILERTEKILRTNIRTLLSNKTIRVRTLNFEEKTADAEPVKKEKTNEGGQRSTDRSTSTREADGEGEINGVQKNNTTPTFQPHQSVLRRQPSFSPPCSERRCLCLPGSCYIHALCRRISCNVINVNQHFVYVTKAQ